MEALGIDIGGSSTKIAALREGKVWWTGQSRNYQRPTKAELIEAIAETLGQKEECLGPVGVCVPGIRDPSGQKVLLSVNLPCLNGVDVAEVAALALGRQPGKFVVTGDSIAAAYDLYVSRALKGRLLSLALGTGVGAAVLDEGIPLRVDGESCGHVGQFDCSVEGHPVIGPDGGAGSLEGYIGVPALLARYGGDMTMTLASLGPGDPPMQALAKAVRICHAIYCPDHIILTGGVGNRMAHLLPTLRGMIAKELTRIAKASWTLTCGEDDYHAARGVARMALSTKTA